MIARCEVHRGVDQPFAAEVPYTVVLVRLDEGIPFITRATDPMEPQQRVSLRWQTVHGEKWPFAVSLSD